MDAELTNIFFKNSDGKDGSIFRDEQDVIVKEEIDISDDEYDEISEADVYIQDGFELLKKLNNGELNVVNDGFQFEEYNSKEDTLELMNQLEFELEPGEIYEFYDITDFSVEDLLQAIARNRTLNDQIQHYNVKENLESLTTASKQIIDDSILNEENFINYDVINTFLQLFCQICSSIKPLADKNLNQNCAPCKVKYLFSCKQCKFCSKSIIQMVSHIKKLHHSNFEKNKEFENLKSLNQEIWQQKQDMYDGKIQPITSCKKCGRPYRCLSRLKRHEKLCTMTPMLQCTLCPEFINFEQELREHLVLKHGKQLDGKELSIMIRDIKKKTKMKKKNIKATQTILVNENSNFLNMNFAQMHVNDMAEVTCTKCKALITKVNTKDLRCTKCRQSYTFTCLGCKSRFKKIGSLRMHYNRKHGPKLFSCQRCNRNFAYLSDLNCHIKLCNESPVYQCKYCITKTKHMTDMRYHLVHEHGVRFGFARSWICHVCGKKYARKQGLILHQRNYCGKKPNFRCSLCSYHSYTKHHLTNHVKTKHSDENNRKKRKVNPVKRR